MPRPETARRRTEPAGSPSPQRLRGSLLAGSVALWVCRPLWASEGAAAYGDGVPVVMLWIALVVFWLLGAVGRDEITVRFGWIDAVVLLLVVLYVISATLGAMHDNPRPAVNVLWEWVGLGLAFFSARQWIADRREARAVLVAMIGLAVTLSAYGLYQNFYELPQTRAIYASNPDAALRSAGVWFAPGSPQRELFESRLRGNQPLATFALTNSLAGLLAAWLTVAAGIGLWSRKGHRRAWLAAVAAGLPIAACLLLTKSRSGYAAALAGLGTLAVIAWGWPLRGRRAWAAVAGVVILLGLAVGVAFAVDREIAAKAVKSLGYRFQYWRATWQMIQDHPLAGCGPGNFQDYYTRYKLPTASEEVADPHNFLLEVWATAGAPAAAALIAVLGGLVSLAWIAARGARQSDSRDVPDLAPATSGEAKPEPRWRLPPVAVMAGAIGGYLLAGVASIVSPSPPSYGLLVAGAIVTAGTFLAFSGWIDSGRLPTVLPAAAACVLLVHLLAAGGISYAGVAGSFWLLAAMAINLAGRDWPKTITRPAIWGLLIAALFVAAACQITGYVPVMQARAAMLRAERLPPGSTDVAENLRRAVEADPWAAAPLERLADIEFAAWLGSSAAARFRQFEWYRGRVLALCPRSSSAWQTSGDYYRRAYQKAGRAEYAQKAAEAYARAADLYPTSVLCRAKLALALKETGDRGGFLRESERALELDRLTPHADKKLPDALRIELRSSKPKG